MYDFGWTELSLNLSLFFNTLFVLYVLIFYKQCVYKPCWSDTRTNRWLQVFSLILVILVASNSNSDWFHYQQLVKDYDFTRGARNHGEPVYGYIIQFVNRNYFLFRLIVWGVGLIMTYLVLRRFSINVNVAIYLIISCFLIRYNYSRTTLAVSLYFFGLSFIINMAKKRKLLNILLAIVFFWLAFEFHHSVLPLIFFSIIAFIPFNKPIILLALLLLLPLMASIILDNLSLVYLFDVDEYMSAKITGYMEYEATRATFFGVLANILIYGAFIIPIIIISITMLRYAKLMPLNIIRLYRVMLAIVFFSASFLFMGVSSTVFAYRYLYMTIIPIAIIAVFQYREKMISKSIFSIIVIWGIVSNIYVLLYGLFKLWN